MLLYTYLWIYVFLCFYTFTIMHFLVPVFSHIQICIFT